MLAILFVLYCVLSDVTSVENLTIKILFMVEKHLLFYLVM